MLGAMTIIYGSVRAIGAAASNPGAGADGTRPLTVDEEGSLYVRFAAGAQAGPRVARVAHSASAVLPAYPSTTNPTAYPIPNGLSEITFWISYTRDAAGSLPRFPRARVVWGNGTDSAADLVIVDTIDSTLDTYARRLAFDGEIDFPTAPSDAAHVYQLTVAVPKGATTAKLLLSEAGEAAHPGTASVFLTGGY